MEMSDRDKEWSGPIDYPHKSDQLDDSKSGGDEKAKCSNCFKELEITIARQIAVNAVGGRCFECVSKQNAVPQAPPTKNNLITETIYELYNYCKFSKHGEQSIHKILSDLYAKGVADGEARDADKWQEILNATYKKAKQEGRAEFAKETIGKIDEMRNKQFEPRNILDSLYASLKFDDL